VRNVILNALASFKRGKPSPTPLEPCVPEDIRLYAVGDIHGRTDLLGAMAGLIESDRKSAQCKEALTVFLGDYVDRGPDSAGVLARLSKGDFPTPIVALRGNHEQMLLDFLEDETVLEAWRLYGGLETLNSFNIDIGKVVLGKGFVDAQEQLRERLPMGDLQFVLDMPSQFSLGDYFFCHAGIRPGVPLDRQTREDLMWIRDDFLRSSKMFGKIIVHGHTPVPVPDVQPNRINIDTGAVLTNKLSCLVMQGKDRSFLST
jgi:serine/threonine protein phosphatase 1